MSIKYNPYGWKIRKNADTQKELLSIKEQERDLLINELQNYDKSIHHKSITGIINDLYEVQEEINSMWKELEKLDNFTDRRPHFEKMEYYSD